MVVGAGPGAVREIMVVLALAVVGLFLATIAVFAPWYGASAEPRRPAVVEMRTPPAPPDDGAALHRAGAS